MTTPGHVLWRIFPERSKTTEIAAAHRVGPNEDKSSLVTDEGHHGFRRARTEDHHEVFTHPDTARAVWRQDRGMTAPTVSVTEVVADVDAGITDNEFPTVMISRSPGGPISTGWTSC